MSILHRHPTVTNKLSFLALCAVGSILLALGFAAAASAESTMSITVGPNPTESITTQLGVTGTATSTGSWLSLKINPSGGEKCGANLEADGGTEVFNSEWNEGGIYTHAIDWSFTSAGSYLLCGWLSDSAQGNDPAVAHAELPITVRQPHITLSISTPGSVAPGKTFQIATTAQAETSREVYEYIEPNNGRGCPANAAAAASPAGSMGIYWPAGGSAWRVEGGPFTETVNETISGAGAYLVCAYAEYPTTESVPEAVTSSAISVASAIPVVTHHPVSAMCVVPRLKGQTLTQAERSLGRAHCKLGRVTKPKHHRHKLVVVSQSPGAKKTTPGGTKVSLRLR